MSDDVKYLTTNSGPQIIKFCNGIIAPLMKNKIPNAPKTFLGKRRYYDETSINMLRKIKYLLKEKGMTLNGVKKVLNSTDSDIDEFYNTTINQKNIIKAKLIKIKKLVKEIKS